MILDHCFPQLLHCSRAGVWPWYVVCAWGSHGDCSWWSLMWTNRWNQFSWWLHSKQRNISCQYYGGTGRFIKVFILVILYTQIVMIIWRKLEFLFYIKQKVWNNCFPELSFSWWYFQDHIWHCSFNNYTRGRLNWIKTQLFPSLVWLNPHVNAIPYKDKQQFCVYAKSIFTTAARSVNIFVCVCTLLCVRACFCVCFCVDVHVFV